MDDGITRIAAGSILVGMVVLGIKYLAYAVTGSIALYSDALESLVNIATAIAALLAVRISAQPADDNHPYGHSKIEYFSAVLAGALIFVAAIAILRAAWAGLHAPRTIDAPALGLALSAVAGLLNTGWSYVLIRRGRALRSPALVADGRHLLSDVVTSGGVLVGILLAVVTGWAVLDPALAAIVAVNILWSGWKVIRESLGGLMDEALPDAEVAAIRTVILDNAGGAIEVHDIRTRGAGRVTFVEFHLVVPGTMTVAESHDICDRIERAIRHAVAGSRITIHVEPEHKAKHDGVPVA